MDDNTIVSTISEIIDEKLVLLGLTQKPFLTTKELALYLGMKESYIRKMTHNREIPHYKPMGKNLYFNRDEIDEWIASSRVATAEEIRREAKRRLKKL